MMPMEQSRRRFLSRLGIAGVAGIGGIAGAGLGGRAKWIVELHGGASGSNLKSVEDRPSGSPCRCRGSPCEPARILRDLLSNAGFELLEATTG
jgi:hypothetical protein